MGVFSHRKGISRWLDCAGWAIGISMVMLLVQ